MTDYKNHKNKNYDKDGAFPSECVVLTEGIQNNGGPITRGKAAGYVKNFKEGIGTTGRAMPNFGYLFGLDKVSAFLEQIAMYNRQTATDKILGVRVYLGRTSPLSNGNTPGEQIMDTVFLIPVKEGGKDTPDIGAFLQGDGILGDPRPCPNQCKMLSFFDQLESEIG